MDDLFPYLGEQVLEHLIRNRPALLLGKLDINPDEFVAVHRQVPLSFPKTNVIFDGFSTIDLALELTNQTVVPIEVKLGHTGLARASMNKKLKPCIISAHQHNTRISGNILAVINRYFDDELSALVRDDALHVALDNRKLALSEHWGIVARNHIIASWSNFPPRFNGRQTLISLETLCRGYGREAFNAVVETLLAKIDYFGSWVGEDT